MKFTLLMASLALGATLIAQPTQQDRKIQNDPVAQKLLDEVSANYHEKPSIKVDFSLMVDTPEEEAYMKLKGWVMLKDEKYKIDTEEMTIICDNVKRYVYLKESNELQINFFEPEDDEIESPSKLFDIYKDDYFFRLNDEITDNNRKLSVVVLIPSAIKNSPYKMIFLYIDKSISQIVKGEIQMRDGSKYTYLISSMQDVPLTDAEFTFNPSLYPGIYIDDMTK